MSKEHNSELVMAQIKIIQRLQNRILFTADDGLVAEWTDVLSGAIEMLNLLLEINEKYSSFISSLLAEGDEL